MLRRAREDDTRHVARFRTRRPEGLPSSSEFAWAPRRKTGAHDQARAAFEAVALNASGAVSAGTGGPAASPCFVAGCESGLRERLAGTMEQVTPVRGASAVTARRGHAVGQTAEQPRRAAPATPFSQTPGHTRRDGFGARFGGEEAGAGGGGPRPHALGSRSDRDPSMLPSARGSDDILDVSEVQTMRRGPLACLEPCGAQMWTVVLGREPLLPRLQNGGVDGPFPRSPCDLAKRELGDRAECQRWAESGSSVDAPVKR